MPATSLRWFTQARFGLLIHWGVYSLYGRGEQVLLREHLSHSEYRQRAGAFKAAEWDPRSWAQVAREAGMGYAVLTARHQDGYCLFDSATTRFTSMVSGPQRDIVRAFVDGSRREGLRVGLRYSLADWQRAAYFAGPRRDPAGFASLVERAHMQVRELCSHYGPLDVMEFDGLFPYSAEDWRARELCSVVRELQPDILIDDGAGVRGDYATCEEQAPDDDGRPWELCTQSVIGHWGFHAGARLWRTPECIIHTLARVGAGGGNLLLNVGPKPSGALPEHFLSAVREVGDWLRTNGQALYACDRGILDCPTVGYTTVRGPTVYVHVLYWPGDTLHLAGLANRVVRARFVADGWSIPFEQAEGHITLRNLPILAPDSRNTVIALEVEGTPQALAWARTPSGEDDLAQLVPWADR